MSTTLAKKLSPLEAELESKREANLKFQMECAKKILVTHAEILRELSKN